MTHALRSALMVVMVTTLPVEAIASTPQDFAYGLPIITDSSGAAYRVPLPMEVYRNVVYPDLRDLRVFNSSGAEVPYALWRPAPAAAPQALSTALPVFALRGQSAVALDGVRIRIQGRDAAVDFHGGSSPVTAPPITSYLIDARTLGAPAAALQLAWPADADQFSGKMRIEASDDLRGWRTVAADAPVVQLRREGSALVQNRMDLPPTLAKFWRLTWVEAPAPFEITSVSAISTDEAPVVRRTTLTVPGAMVPGSPSDAVFDLGGQFPVTRLNIGLAESNSVATITLFSRRGAGDVWRRVGESDFSRLRKGPTEQVNAPLDIQSDPDPLWLAHQLRPAGAIGAVTLQATWDDMDLVFLARGPGPYTLAYGNGAAVGSTISLGAALHGITILPATTGPARPLGGRARLLPPARTVPWRMAVLWGCLGAGVALLAFMAYRLSRELGNQRGTS